MGGASRREAKQQPGSDVLAARPASSAIASSTLLVAALLFVSGACALTYQLTWLRLLRLVFGHSTAASAAVLGIFMGGLGLGAIVLGRRADRHPNPLRLYAVLEIGIAASVAATPFLIDATRDLYTGIGGSAQLGITAATALRLLLSIVVLGVPTFLMGATLSAAARAVEIRGEDRWRTAALYGCNTLGAVSGVLLANFVLLESLGTQRTLLAAAAANAVLAAAAWLASKRAPWRADVVTESAAGADDVSPGNVAVRRLVLATAAVAGSAFLLMELVWYRMLAPLLGGSTYTFGVILAVALLGIGLGGLAYALEPSSRRKVTIGRLSLVTALEALCAIVPLALGDRIALLTMSLQPLGAGGFDALVVVWTFVTAIVVLPMAVVSGYQLPLLIALIGSRSENVGADVGRVYGFNTAGAIFGSLAGGFGMIPGLGALGTWRAIAASLVALGVTGAAIAWKRREAVGPGVVALAIGAIALLLTTATGPTALWRHTPIGAGLTAGFGSTPNEMRAFVHDVRRGVHWEEDGVESSVAVTDTDAFSLMMNGKSDGNAIADASTMIMTGVLPAIVHDGPKRALVIGLGLGTSAGWLAKVPSIEHVDVVELEPSVLRAAREAAAVNEGVMDNPKVRFVLGDAREYLLTTSERYDIIASEPSNPYRAGVASLFTVEYYEAAKRALATDGVFAQWVQTYAVGDATVKTVYATLASVFDSVESWEVQLGTDLLLLARNDAPPHDIGKLRTRLESEPFRSALRNAWGLSGIDGLFAGYVAGPPMARAIRAATPNERLNTDDSTVIEFEFARSLGRADNQILGMIRKASLLRPEFAPTLTGGAIDWAAVEELRPARSLQEEKAFNAEGFSGSDEALARVHARVSYAAGRFDQVRLVWAQQQRESVHPIDVLLVAESLADGGDDKCIALAERLKEWSVADAEAVLARYHEKTGDLAQATEHLERSFTARRASAWGYRPLLRRSLTTAWRVAEGRKESVAPLLAALGEPFAAHVSEDRRVFARASIAMQWGPPEDCAQYLEPSEPWVPFDRALLTKRAECYQRVNSRFLAQAQRDLHDFEASAPPVAFEPGSR